MGALYKGFFVTGALSLILLWPLTNSLIGMETTVETSFIKFRYGHVSVWGIRACSHNTYCNNRILHGHNYRPVKSVVGLLRGMGPT